MDANAVLQAAPDSVKAHFRAGQAYIAVKVSLLVQLAHASDLIPLAPPLYQLMHPDPDMASRAGAWAEAVEC